MRASFLSCLTNNFFFCRGRCSPPSSLAISRFNLIRPCLTRRLSFPSLFAPTISLTAFFFQPPFTYITFCLSFPTNPTAFLLSFFFVFPYRLPSCLCAFHRRTIINPKYQLTWSLHQTELSVEHGLLGVKGELKASVLVDLLAPNT